MAVKWHSTGSRGVRFYEHAARKHGVKLDRYYAIRFQSRGRSVEEGLGWASDGWTETRAADALSDLRKAARVGEGPITLAEKNALAEQKRKEKALAEAESARALLSLADVWPKYLETATTAKKPQSIRREKELWSLWIAPAIGKKPLKQLSPLDLERLKKRMAEAGRAPRSIHYGLAVVRQVINFARNIGLFSGDNPVSKVKKPTADNRRLRFLTHEEADRLLEALALKSPLVHDQALLSLHCGLRAGEIFALTWADLDFDRGVLTIRDSKSGRTRPALMTEAVKMMLAARRKTAANGLVFPSEKGTRIGQISQTFIKTVTALGFNDGLTDPRQKVVFHTLRHTFASWLVEQGTDLYVVQELMGHHSFAMVQRYAHLSPDTLRRAVRRLEAGIKNADKGKVVKLPAT